jgi:hypothetical protein
LRLPIGNSDGLLCGASVYGLFVLVCAALPLPGSNGFAYATVMIMSEASSWKWSWAKVVTSCMMALRMS